MRHRDARLVLNPSPNTQLEYGYSCIGCVCVKRIRLQLPNLNLPQLNPHKLHVSCCGPLNMTTQKKTPRACRYRNSQSEFAGVFRGRHLVGVSGVQVVPWGTMGCGIF